MPRTKAQNEQIREERRKAILQAAIALFARQGFDQTSVSAIAKEVGVSHGTIFLYFATKEELFQAAVLEPLSEAESHFQSVLKGPGGARERVERLIREQITAISLQAVHLRLVHHLIGQRDRFPEIVAEVFSFSQRFIGSLAPVIREAQAAGELAPGNAESVAVSYYAYLNGVGLVCEDEPASPLWPRMIENGFRILGASKEGE